jgi:hypothetical protein
MSMSVCTVVKRKGKISQNLVAFSEYMNFKRHLIFAFATTHFTRLHAVYFNCIFLTFTSLHHFFAFLRRQKIFAFVKWPVIVTNFNKWYTGLRFFPTVILTLGIIQLKIISNITRVGKEYKNLWQTLVDMIFPCLNFPFSFLNGKSNQNKQCQKIPDFGWFHFF